MTSPAPLPFSETSFALSLGLLLLAPLAITGVALINTGLGRSRSAAQSLLGSLVMMAVAVIAFALVGATFATVPPLTSSSSPLSLGTGLAQAPCC